MKKCIAGGAGFIGSNLVEKTYQFKLQNKCNR